MSDPGCFGCSLICINEVDTSFKTGIGDIHRSNGRWKIWWLMYVGDWLDRGLRHFQLQVTWPLPVKAFLLVAQWVLYFCVIYDSQA